MVKAASFFVFTFLLSFLTQGKAFDERTKIPESPSLEDSLRNTPMILFNKLDLSTLEESELRTILQRTKDYTPANSTGPFDQAQLNFQTHLQALNLLYLMGKMDMQEFVSLYNFVQSQLTEAEGECFGQFENPLLYCYWFQCLADMNPETRATLANDYKVGNFPFPVNKTLAEFYKKPLDLPLTNVQIFEWKELSAASCPLQTKK